MFILQLFLVLLLFQNSLQSTELDNPWLIDSAELANKYCPEKDDPILLGFNVALLKHEGRKFLSKVTLEVVPREQLSKDYLDKLYELLRTCYYQQEKDLNGKENTLFKDLEKKNDNNLALSKFFKE